MINFKNISIFFLVILGNNFYSQQTPNFSQFFLQDYYYNASIGSEEYDLKINYLHRRWGNNYQFSPKNDFIGLALPLSRDKKFGFLFSFLNNQNGQAFKTVVINPGVSYDVKLASSIYLGTGLSLNFSEHSFINDNLDNLEFGDLSLQNIKQTSITPSFGLNLKFDNSKNFKLQLGFSSTNIHDFRQPINKSLFEGITEQYNVNFKIRAGKINERNISWNTLFRGHNGIINYNGWSNTRLPKSISSAIYINNLFETKNKVSFGGVWNGFFDENEKLEHLSISPFLSAYIKEDFPFKIGVSYDIGIAKFQTLTNGTIELSVSVLADDLLYKKSTKNLDELEEEDLIDKKEKRKKPKPNPFLKPEQKLNAILAGFDIEIYYIDGGFKKINFTGDENGNFNVSIPDPDGFLDIKGNHITGDYFKMKITPNNSKSNHFYTVSFSDKDNSQIKGEVKILTPKFPFSYFNKFKISLPKNLEVDDYYLLIRCLNDDYESDYIKIPIFIQDYD